MRVMKKAVPIVIDGYYFPSLGKAARNIGQGLHFVRKALEKGEFDNSVKVRLATDEDDTTRIAYHNIDIGGDSMQIDGCSYPTISGLVKALGCSVDFARKMTYVGRPAKKVEEEKETAVASIPREVVSRPPAQNMNHGVDAGYGSRKLRWADDEVPERQGPSPRIRHYRVGDTKFDTLLEASLMFNTTVEKLQQHLDNGTCLDGMDVGVA